MRPGLWPVAVALSSLALASCGGGDDDSGDSGQQSNSPDPQPSGQTNRAPTITGNAPGQVLVGNSYDFTPSASDADGDTLTYSAENLPTWADFNTSTGRLSGTPEEGDLGTYTGIRITVSDGEATASLGTFTIEVVATGSGSATLSWTAPTQKTDGSAVDLAGYKIYWGTSSRSYSHSVTLETPGIATYVVENLTPDTWYFAVTAYDSQGLESIYSNEATKKIL